MSAPPPPSLKCPEAAEARREAKRKRDRERRAMASASAKASAGAGSGANTGDDTNDDTIDLAVAMKILKRAYDNSRERNEASARLDEENRALRQEVARLAGELENANAALADANAALADANAALADTRADKERLEARLAMAEPVAKVAYSMREVCADFDKAVNAQSACEFCTMDELQVTLNGDEFIRMKCPECDRVNMCCGQCLPTWKNDPRHPGKCLNRGHCDCKIV